MATTKSGSEGKIAGLYELDRTLGKGHFAVVKLARHVFTGQLVAVKIIDKTKLDGLAMGHLLQEVRCMKLVQHPNVVRLYEVIDTHTKLYLILELGDGGDLYDYILRHEHGVAERTAKVHFAQIVRAIAYCHRLHVVHRDLKPENVVFFRQQGTVKLTDFGFSNHFQPGTMLVTSCGSLAYSAPEILLGEEYDAPAVDIWSLGVILYMLVCGRPPFQEANDSETLIMIMDCRYTVPDHVSAECKDLISRMLQRDPSKRAPLLEIESHLWLQGVDASPSPVSPHCSLSPQEHELILQAMISGNISDRDAIQEALDADRYNHITATYYLLGERILRDKQEWNGVNPEQRQTQRPFSDLVECRSSQIEALRDASLTPVTQLVSVSPGFPRFGVCETGDLLAPKPSRQDTSFGDFGSPSSCLGLSFRSVPPDPPPVVKSLRALHQICEEEEENEEEEEEQPVLQSSKDSFVPPATSPLETSPRCCLLTNALNVSEKLNRKVEEKSMGNDRNVIAEVEKLHGEGEAVIKNSQGDSTSRTTTQNETSSQTERLQMDQRIRKASGPPPAAYVKNDHTKVTRKEEKASDTGLDGRWKDNEQLVGHPGNGRTRKIIQTKEPSTTKQKDQNQSVLNPTEPPSAVQADTEGPVEAIKASVREISEADIYKTDRCLPTTRTEKIYTEASDCTKEEGNKNLKENSNHSPASQIENKNPVEEPRIADKAEDDSYMNQKLHKFTDPPTLDAVQCCWGHSKLSNDTLEDNNNTLFKPKLLDTSVISAPCVSPRFLPKNHCVDLRPDGVETRKVPGEAERTEETYSKPQQGQRGSKDAGTESNKNKNVNLRDRLLQFPLCEKALSFNIQPTSKEKLLPFAQYNCCHVL
ncbi:SNF-related serine/threonine-protein kinase [Bagarius yarrelli]|uniref:SNF-related serine/threonine-protein kinase n=1 Tax=Bagarius yarrelli TaxID=175774 RepID=A0A556V0L1_BAGYA|nr:SNF-related serine/threonine-protein kinase [Bagarius yarrelli]